MVGRHQAAALSFSKSSMFKSCRVCGLGVTTSFREACEQAGAAVQSSGPRRACQGRSRVLREPAVILGVPFRVSCSCALNAGRAVEGRGAGAARDGQGAVRAGGVQTSLQGLNRPLVTGPVRSSGSQQSGQRFCELRAVWKHGSACMWVPYACMHDCTGNSKQFDGVPCKAHTHGRAAVGART